MAQWYKTILTPQGWGFKSSSLTQATWGRKKAKHFSKTAPKFDQIQRSRGCIFSHVRPFYERAVSNLDRSMHRSLRVLITHSSFIEGSHTTKNTARVWTWPGIRGWIFIDFEGKRAMIHSLKKINVKPNSYRLLPTKLKKLIVRRWRIILVQGSLTEGEGSVH